MCVTLFARWRRWRQGCVIAAAAAAFLATAAILHWLLPVRPYLVLKTPGPRCWPAAFSPDGRWFAGISYRDTEHSDHCDITLRIWDAATGAEATRFDWYQHDPAYVQTGLPSIRYSPDSQFALIIPFGVLDEPHPVSLVEVRSGQSRIAFKGRDYRFAPDSRTLAIIVEDAANKQPCVAVIEPATGRELARISGVHEYCFVPDGQSLAAVCDDERTNMRCLKLFETKTGKELALVSRGPKGPNDSSFSFLSGFLPDGRTLMLTELGEEESGFVFWDVLARRTRWKMPTNWEYAGHTPNGRIVASRNNGEGNPRIKLWDAESGRSLGELAVPDGRKWQGGIRLYFSPDGKTMTAACTIKTWVSLGQEPRYTSWDAGFTWNLQTLELIGSYNHGQRSSLGNGYVVADNGTAWDKEYAADEMQPYPLHIVRTLEDDDDAVVEFATGKERFPLPLNSQEWNCFAHSWYAFSPDGKLFAVDAAVFPKPNQIWDWLSARVPVVFSPSKPAERIRCWDSATGKEYSSVPGGALECAFSPDSRLLAVPYDDGTFRIWEMPPRKPLGLILAWSTIPASLVLLVAWWRGTRRKRAEDKSCA